mmetsp:Transcript_22757/g.79054  ORF Transcript_22757/g.79054 Transcript_22757/m.79054 type:complete len:216 (+) Transcript_22757:201-848(+)
MMDSIHSMGPGVETMVNVDNRNDASQAEWAAALSGPNDSLLVSPNVHQARAFNRVAAMAWGEYLAFLQGDLCVPTQGFWFDDAVKLFNADYKLGPLGGRAGVRLEIERVEYNTTIETSSRGEDSRLGRSEQPIDLARRIEGDVVPMRSVDAVSVGPLIVKRDTLFGVGAFDEDMSCAGDPASTSSSTSVCASGPPGCGSPSFGRNSTRSRPVVHS